jgi:hypothetical protein
MKSHEVSFVEHFKSTAGALPRTTVSYDALPAWRGILLSSFQQAVRVRLQCCTLDFLPETTRRTNAAGHIEELPYVRSPEEPLTL